MISGCFKVDLDHAILYIIIVTGEACSIYPRDYACMNPEIRRVSFIFFKPLVTITRFLNLVYARFAFGSLFDFSHKKSRVNYV